MTLNLIKETTIIIVEDDDGHALLIENSLKRSGIKNPIIHLKDGLDAYNFFKDNIIDSKEKIEKKYLILLDIKMPKMNGIDFLKKMKNDSKLKTIPIIMLTTTDDPIEIHSCYDLGCNAYVVKPVDFSNFSETLKRIAFFVKVIKITAVN
ncbi:MAG: response regulator [Spirochaetes bacterium]|nr:response regulator [Spirochaetota bacterium]